MAAWCAHMMILFLLLTAERFARECAELNGNLFFSKQEALEDAYFFIGRVLLLLSAARRERKREERERDFLAVCLGNRFARLVNKCHKRPHANMASDPFEKVEMAHAYRLTLDSKCQRVKENAISKSKLHIRS